MTLKKADFSKWRNRDLWKLYEGISLLLGMEPTNDIRKVAQSDGAFFSNSSYGCRRCPKFVHQLQNLYRLATDAMKIGTLRTYNGYFGLVRNYIDESFYPREFLEWAQSKRYEIPEELKLLLPQSVSDYRKESEAKPTTYEFEQSKQLGRRKQQLLLITEVITRLGYDPLAIPNGGKAKIKKICEENNSLFKETSFNHAWKEARQQGKVRMANHEVYFK